MKYLMASCLIIPAVIAQGQNSTTSELIEHHHKFYFYWGYNWSWYTKSDIRFTGKNYDFVLHDVIAKDRQTTFSFDQYFSPRYFTVPQYNYRLGYFFRRNLNISVGIDHMKYVVIQKQTVKISGNIHDTQTNYAGGYVNEDIILATDLVIFEHTDGLNYIDVEIGGQFKIKDFNWVVVNFTQSAGLGVIIPKTNTRLFNHDRYDEFRLSGFGLNIELGGKLSFLKKFFIQTEINGGYISMPDIRTTGSNNDKARQSFFFAQWNVVFGGLINLKKKDT